MSKRALWVLAGLLGLTLAALGCAGIVRDFTTPFVPAAAVTLATDYRRNNVGVIEGGELTLLTQDKSSYLPSWSPDGSQIAYLHGDDSTYTETGGWERDQIWIVNANGTGAHAVSEYMEGVEFSAPIWMPDGQSVLYVQGEAVMRLDLRTEESIVVVVTGWRDRGIGMQLSADGESLVYSDGRALMSVEFDTGAVTQLVEGVDWRNSYGGDWWTRDDPPFALSPDGRSVATGAVDQQLTIIDLDDGTQEKFATDALADVSRVSWSPDGDWLVMQARSLSEPKDDGGVWAYHMPDGSMWQVSANIGVTYTWLDGDEIINSRFGLQTRRNYITDLGDRSTRSIDSVECPTCEVYGMDWRVPA